ncbi:MAG: group 1 truncated hemoglobin [Paucibacter sp.]|nr:group 1 truncated hemoglobin [Roseateles sp.]
MEMQRMRSVCLPVLAACICLAAGAAPPDDSTLYARLGGEPTVSKVITRTIERAAHDPRTQRSFDGVKLATVEASIVQQICSISGGGCKYEGETMARAHQSLNIRASEFDALVDMLREEFDAAGVSAGAKNELLKQLAPMKRDIVPAG